MENRTPIDFKFVPTTFFEARISKKDNQETYKTITSKRLGELEAEINVWLKCGNYSLLSVERIERHQISLS